KREARAVVAYMTALAGRSSTTLLADVGEKLYADNCLSCHGPTGDRIPIAPLDAKGFLDARTDTDLDAVTLTGKGAMAGFGNEAGGRLTAGDATAITSFLRYQVQAIVAREVS